MIYWSPLPRRLCSAETPMPHELRDVYQWSHPDATEVMPFFNLVVYTCPHCKHTFHAESRQQ